MKRVVSLVCLLGLLLSGCTSSREPEQIQFFAMDTVMSVTVYGKNAEDAARAVQARMNELDRLWSRTNQDSDISRINAAAGDGTAVEIDPVTGELLSWGNVISAGYTGGAFNHVIAPVMDAWGFTSEEGNRVPDPGQLQQLLPLTRSLPEVQLSENMTKATAKLPMAGQAVDVGAIAKGAASNQAQEILRQYDVEFAWLDLGGNISVVGQKPDGTPFRVAVKDPRNTQEYLCVLTLKDGQVCSTSGGYERYFEQDGVTYHHIIDPGNGYPADSGLLSVTVVSEDGKWADALSTAFFVLGEERALDIWKYAGEEYELILVNEDGHILVTEGLGESFEMRREENGYTYEIVYR